MRNAFLALLSAGPAHGYELKRSFEQAFEGIWPEINAGQIYTTLSRLTRDGLVTSHEVSQADRPNKKVFELTDAGRNALAEWLAEPSEKSRIKDEFFMKLVLAEATGAGDPQQLIDRQRLAYLSDLRSLTTADNGDTGPVRELLSEGAALHIEADLRWLDLLEQRLDDLTDLRGAR